MHVMREVALRRPNLLLLAAVICCLTPFARADEKLGYNQFIRPIFSDNCFNCHGPDKNKRKAKLRLDDRDSALVGGKSGDPAIIPGKPADSELIKRLFSDDPDEMMPPAEAHKTVTAAQKELIRKWI